MGLFSHTKKKDKLIKYLNEKNISVNDKNGKVEIEIMFKDKGYSLFPYFVIDEDNEYFSIVINLRKVTEKTSVDLYTKINEFNLISQYFTLKISNDNILFLEYNTLFDDNLKDIFDEVKESLFELKDVIDTI